MNAWQDQTWWLQIFCKTRRVFLFFFHMSPTDSVFVGLSICVRVWEVLAEYLWNISRAAHSGWLNKTQSQPLRLSSVILPKTAEQTRLWQAFSVGLFFFFLFFSHPGDTTEGQLWHWIRTQADHITSLAPWERLRTTMPPCSMQTQSESTFPWDCLHVFFPPTIKASISFTSLSKPVFTLEGKKITFY